MMVSIIVPVYKAEQYIDRCIKSILSQTFQDYELILVDDGSPDNCGKICDEYAKKDKRIKVVHKKNEGVSAARNIGIELSKGEYIVFCDSDDYVHPQWCELLVDAIEKNIDSFVVCSYRKVNNDTLEPEPCKKNENVSKAVSYYEIFKLGISGGVWNKVYKSSIIKDSNIRFDPDVPIGEDALFNSEYMKHCQNCILINKELYYYFENEKSAMGKYYINWLKYHLDVFYCRLPYIKDEFIPEYCDIWLCSFIRMLNNIHDKRNKMSWREQMRYNQKMLHSKEFTYCIEHATGKNESPKLMKILKTKNYYLYWLITRIKK